MTAYSSQGQTVKMDVESSLGTGSGSAVNIRVTEEPQGPRSTRELVEVPTVLYHPGETDDPIANETYREGALTLNMDLRAGNTAAAKPPYVKALESAGATSSVVTATTLDGYTSTTSWSLTADNADVGEAALLELDSGVHWPVVPATDSSGDITPYFEIPSAASVSNAWSPIHSVTPRYSQVPTDQTLTIDHTVRAAHTSNQTLWRYSGCALSEAGEIAMAPQQKVTVSPVFHVGDVAQSDSAIATETFGDSAPIFLGGSNFEVAFCDASTSSIAQSGNIANIESATISLGVTSLPVVGDGGANGLNGLQGYVSQYTPATVALTLLWDKAYSDDIENETFQDKYFHVKQGNTTGKPVFGFWAPNMHLSAPAEVTSEGGYWKVNLTYTTTIPGYNSETGLTDNGAAPWILALGVAP